MNTGGINILLVDDDEDDYILTRDLLVECYRDGCHLEWLVSPEPALEALMSGRFDVCLLDYRLGEQTGLDLLRRGIDQGCNTPVIVLSGQGDRSIDVDAMMAGAADFLVKGEFEGHLLERSIRYTLEHQRTLDALRRSEERFALAVRGANDGLWDWDLRTDQLYLTPRWKAMLGLSESAVGDTPQEWFSRIHPHDVDHVRAEVDAHLSGESSHLEVEYRMLHQDGGVRWVLTRGIAVRDAHEQAIRMAGSQSDVTQRRTAEERLQHDAFHDALTGLPNRALFTERLGRAIERVKRRPEYRFAVLFLDLDGFKLINDSLGHQAGDQFLIAISRRLENCCRRADTVGRLGGDEFVILMDDFEDPSDVFRLADRVLEELKVPLDLNGQETVATASIGIAQGGDHYDSADDILRDADIAMYRAKAKGKAGRVMFDRSMHLRAVARMKLESDLRVAALREEFRLHYQPIVSLRTGRIIGFEALARWQHPERGLVPPDEFIPVLEETGLILSVGMWVIREATTQLKRWHTAFPSTPPLTMGVNLSCRQFFQPDLVAQIERVLDELSMDAGCLRMEVTESVVMERAEAAPAALARLNALGVRLAMDDFGKGYSSLSYLHQFPFDTLKIDRSFIERLSTGGKHEQIVRTICSLAEGLGMDVVAEGVETLGQLDKLRDMGCRFGQGYYFSRPLTPEAAGTLLTQAVDRVILDVPRATVATPGRPKAEPVSTTG